MGVAQQNRGVAFYSSVFVRGGWVGGFIIVGMSWLLLSLGCGSCDRERR